VGVVVLILGLLLGAAVGYAFFFNKRSAIERAIKPDTSTTAGPLSKITAPRTKIVESGYNVDVTISPSTNNTLTGAVEITATKTLPEAKGVGFFISTDETGFQKEGLPNIEIDRNDADGWSTTFDTTQTDNGNYFINTIVYSADGNAAPLGIAQIPVEIKN